MHKRSSSSLPPATIFIPFHLPWDRPADYQRQTCFELAKQHRVVAVANNQSLSLLQAGWGLITHQPQLQIATRYQTPANHFVTWFRPIKLLPFQRFYQIKSLNLAVNIGLMQVWLQLQQFWISLHHRNKNSASVSSHRNVPPIIWIFDPQFVGLCTWLKGWFSLYDCVDYHRAAAQPTMQTQMSKWENELIKQAQLFIVNSQILKTAHATVRTPDLITVQGFAYDSYKYANNALPTESKPRQPRIGFIGALNQRLDYELLIQLAQHQPNWQFVLIGPIETPTNPSQKWQQQLQSLLQLPNVRHFAYLPKNELSSYLQTLTVGIIPYQPNQSFNYYCSPMKLFEYFYVGLPVISTLLPEVQRHQPWAVISHNPADWCKLVRFYYQHPISDQDKQTMRQIAISQAYRYKITSILNAIAGKLAK